MFTTTIIRVIIGCAIGAFIILILDRKKDKFEYEDCAGQYFRDCYCRSCVNHYKPEIKSEVKSEYKPTKLSTRISPSPKPKVRAKRKYNKKNS